MTQAEAPGSQRNSVSLRRPSMQASKTSTMSLSRRTRMAWVSGSPKRVLYSSTMGPRRGHHHVRR